MLEFFFMENFFYIDLIILHIMLIITIKKKNKNKNQNIE